MISEVQDKLEEIREICRSNQVATLYLFGSAARGDFNEKSSDIDFAIRFLPSARVGISRFLQTQDDLHTLLGKQVDLVEYESQKPRLRAEIERDQELLYAA